MAGRLVAAVLLAMATSAGTLVAIAGGRGPGWRPAGEAGAAFVEAASTLRSPAPRSGRARVGAVGGAEVRRDPGLVVPADAARAAHMDPEHWRQLVLSFHDWPGRVVLMVAWCESRDEWWQVEPVSGATGLFQVLGGSIDPARNVFEAHRRYLAQGLGAWRASRSCWGEFAP